jgi:two-component system, OmpR family, response regulator
MPTTQHRHDGAGHHLNLSRVLVVDDYRGAAIAVATYFSLDGVDARVAGGCGDALEIVRNWHPDVVLLDILMPQRDGFETAHAMRQYSSAAGMLIVAYTGADKDVIERNPYSVEFDGYARKGTPPDKLVSFVKQLCVSH